MRFKRLVRVLARQVIHLLRFLITFPIITLAVLVPEIRGVLMSNWVVFGSCNDE